MAYPNPADLAAMKTDPAVNLMSQEGLNVGYLAFNTEKAPFTDVKVRQALNMASTATPSSRRSTRAPEEGQEPDPADDLVVQRQGRGHQLRSRSGPKLLTDAGFPNGFETDLWAMPVQRPYNPNARRMAEMVQADWAKIGVKAKIVSFEWPEYLRRTRREHQTVLMGWTGDYGDPDNFLYVLLGCDAAGGANRARFCDQPFNDLLVKAKRTPDVAKRTKLYEEAQVVFKEQAPWLTVAHSVFYDRCGKTSRATRSTRSAAISSTAWISTSRVRNGVGPRPNTGSAL